MEHQTKQAEYMFGNIPEIDNKKYMYVQQIKIYYKKSVITAKVH